MTLFSSSVSGFNKHFLQASCPAFHLCLLHAHPVRLLGVGVTGSSTFCPSTLGGLPLALWGLHGR